MIEIFVKNAEKGLNMTCKEIIIDYLRFQTMANPSFTIYNHTLTEVLPSYGRNWHNKYYSGGTYERMWRMMKANDEFKDNELIVTETDNRKDYKEWTVSRKGIVKSLSEVLPIEAELFL